MNKEKITIITFKVIMVILLSYYGTFVSKFK